MKKIILLLFFSVALSLGASAQSTMTDEQVLSYVENSLAAGKDKKIMAKELSARGVNRQQAQRVWKMYQEKVGGAESVEKQAVEINRSHIVSTNQMNADKKDAVTSMLAEESEMISHVAEASSQVFGRDIFMNKNLDFSPSPNIATPEDYRLGPGDQVIIDVFGANQTTLSGTISPEGSINIDVLGPVYLSGMTIEEANAYLKKRLAQIYAGLKRGNVKTDIRLSLGQIRSIQVNVLGDVEVPGTYTLSSFSTVFHALYKAGGIKEPGSLRNIKVSRNGRIIATVDVYDFIQNGNTRSDVRLNEGDVILVPAYTCMVKLSGMVKRPMYFEMKEDESLKQLIEYAGGFAKGAYTNTVTVTRQTGKDYEVCDVDNFDFASFEVRDGDEVEVGELISRFENRVTIRGAVYHPGVYQVGKVTSLRELVGKADGLLPEAFTSHVVMHRENEDLSLEALSIDLGKIMDGSEPDIVLKNNDVVYVPNSQELRDEGTLTIQGDVANPGTFQFAKNTKIEDLIIQAGGLLESASLSKIDVSRRVKEQHGLKAQQKIGEMYTFTIQEGLIVEGDPDFRLEPYDIVYVRRSPSYVQQRNVSIGGEVNFPGTYPLTMRNERLTDLVKKGGGATDFAYTKGARLTRKITDEEYIKLKEVYRQINLSGDSLTRASVALGTEYFVGIELDKALAEPGGKYDVVLRDSDRLEIPGEVTTVRVSGAVQNPNVLTYEAGKSVKYYIEQAGGYGDGARKRKTFVLHMNGHITKARKTKAVDPGDEIVVPIKTKKDELGLQGILSIGTTSAALATTLATIANLIK